MTKEQTQTPPRRQRPSQDDPARYRDRPSDDGKHGDAAQEPTPALPGADSPSGNFLAAPVYSGLELHRGRMGRSAAGHVVCHACRPVRSAYLVGHELAGLREGNGAGFRRAHADFLRTELDLGFTFLDIAARSADLAHRHRCVCVAITALRTAYRFSGPALVSDSEIHQLREELCERLRRACD